jgi:hypothetical protein
MLVAQFIKHIRIYRRDIVQSKQRYDHGFLFVSERGGHALASETLTTEFSKIRAYAGIEEQACAHMFRHSFCTHIVASLIAELQAESPASFRQTILTNKMVAERAMALTGHATLESLLDYVDDAFRHRSKFSRIINNVYSQLAYETYEKRRKLLIQQHKNKIITDECFYDEDEALTAAMYKELEIASKRTTSEFP